MALSDAMLRAGCTLRLRRFSKDLGYIDDLLPLTGLDFFSLALFTVSTVVLVCVLDPYVLLAVAPCVVVLVWVRQYNVKTSREVKRIEGMCRSPVYAHLTNTTDGLAVLRAYPGATQQ
eukprot:m.991253 g.991253  ORF g.991253 m.991253 type:complete len:118 (-) comp24003_c0_seq24:2205-2558(-)